jgi:predicted lipoprotein with Yx(FWY)xxD motif
VKVSRTSAALLVLLFALAGCGSDDPGPSRADETSAPEPAPSSVSPAPPIELDDDVSPRDGTKIITADSEYGPMLYDATGQPIYLFTAEPGERPACYDDCAADWPPVLTDGEPRAAADVREGLLGTTRRTGGDVQVTYAGHPLYYYAHEGKYEVLCHDIDEYGGTWLVVQPDGRPAPA